MIGKREGESEKKEKRRERKEKKKKKKEKKKKKRKEKKKVRRRKNLIAFTKKQINKVRTDKTTSTSDKNNLFHVNGFGGKIIQLVIKGFKIFLGLKLEDIFLFGGSTDLGVDGDDDLLDDKEKH